MTLGKQLEFDFMKKEHRAKFEEDLKKYEKIMALPFAIGVSISGIAISLNEIVTYVQNTYF